MNVHALLLLPMEIDVDKFRQPSPLGLIIMFWFVVLVISSARWRRLHSRSTEGPNDTRTRIAQGFTLLALFGLLLSFISSDRVRNFADGVAGLAPGFTVQGVHVSSTNFLIILIIAAGIWWLTKPQTWKLVVLGILTLAGMVTIPWMSTAASWLVNNIGSIFYNLFFVDVPNLLLGG